MRLVFEKMPPLMVIGYIGDKDFKILDIDNNEILLESCDLLDDLINKGCHLSIKIFDYNKGEYINFTFEQFHVKNYEVNRYYYIYRIELLGENCRNLYSVVGKVKEIYEFAIHNKTNDMQKKLSHSNLFQDKNTYDYEKDREVYSNFSEQLKDWLSINISNEVNERFRNISPHLELAFSINSPRLYSQFSQGSFSEAIMSNIQKLNISNHGIFSKTFSRVYIGNEFCHNLLPDTDLLMKLFNNALSSGYQITMVLPYLIEENINGIADLIKTIEVWCEKNNTNIEVCINDFGVLKLIDLHNLHIELTLGRLLNKRKKDPRVNLMSSYDRYKQRLGENNLNFPIYSRFLGQKGIKRYEYESYFHKNKIASGKHSMHFPFYQITTSTYCKLYSECTYFNKIKQHLVLNCPKYCEELCFLYPKHLKMIGKGNTTFGFDDTLFINSDMLKEYVDEGVDRLVLSVD